MHSTLHAQSLQDPKRLYIFTVGGCGEFGMNLTIYANRGQCLIVDCGLSFAEPFEIGIDAHIPAWEDLAVILGCMPAAYLITHGHEDHLGALPYFLAHWPAPVYIGPWAQELLKDKLKQMGDDIAHYEMHEMKAGEKCQIGSVRVDWLHVPHSIPHCCSLILDAGDGLKAYHTGDFKLRGFQSAEADLPLDQLRRMAKTSPFLVMVADSTNALTAGNCPSEDTVLPELKLAIANASGVTYITTFSSNLWRIKTILLAAKSMNKKVLAFGAGIRRSLENGAKLRLLGEESSALIDEDGANRLARKDLVVLCSGCQGEYRSGLKRIINDEVGHLRVSDQDQVIFSSRVIPGNEKNIFKLMSLCHQKGAKVVSAREKPGIHVSGHAYANDLLEVLDAVKPRFYMPVHGTYTQIRANQALAADKDSIIDATNGLLVALSPEGHEVMASYQLDPLFIDSWSRLPMRFEMMRSRHKIGDSGLAIASGVLGPAQKIQLEIDFIGLPFDNQADEEKCESQLINSLSNLYQRCYQNKDFSAANFNEQARLLIRRELTDRFVKKPVVISKIFSVDR